MQLYEIRILNGDFTTRTIVAQQYMSDHAAVRAARMFAEPVLFEVWRGMTCIYASSPPGAAAVRFAKTAGKELR